MLAAKTLCQRSEISRECQNHSSSQMTCYVLNLDRLSCCFRSEMTDGCVSGAELRRFGRGADAGTIGIEMRRTTEIVMHASPSHLRLSLSYCYAPGNLCGITLCIIQICLFVCSVVILMLKKGEAEDAITGGAFDLTAVKNG